MAGKFMGSFDELRDKVLLTGVNGEWKDLGQQKQFRADTGAILNFWPSNKTINFQGNKDAATDLEYKLNSDVLDAGAGGTVRVAPSAKAAAETKIFIVHGHDTNSLDQLELILRRLGLDPYILQKNDGKSRTLIEALEQQIYSQSAFGIILMTPDDYGYTKTGTDADRQPRARQNVILEMGMVLASLGRERMVILKKGNLEMPSDVNGVIYLEFNEHVREIATKLAQRMKSAGIAIDDALIASAAC